MCTHGFVFSIQDSESIPEHPRKKSKPSVDSETHCSKDLVIFRSFLLMFTLNDRLERDCPAVV